MKNVKYQIDFFSCWHCGSGLSAGADVDELVVKDKRGLPFVPGRTLKGLLRDACDDVCRYAGLAEADIRRVFGFFADDPDEAVRGCAFFSDAEIPRRDADAIVAERLADCLYRSVASTAIDVADGVAVDASLRKVQVVVPCRLVGSVAWVPDDFVDGLGLAMGLVKRLGRGRGGGLGRCQMSVVSVSEEG